MGARATRGIDVRLADQHIYQHYYKEGVNNNFVLGGTLGLPSNSRFFPTRFKLRLQKLDLFLGSKQFSLFSNSFLVQSFVEGSQLFNLIMSCMFKALSQVPIFLCIDGIPTFFLPDGIGKRFHFIQLLLTYQ